MRRLAGQLGTKSEERAGEWSVSTWRAGILRSDDHTPAPGDEATPEDENAHLTADVGLGKPLSWRRWLRLPLAGAAGFESGRYLLRWLLIGLAIGTVAGLGAIVF